MRVGFIGTGHIAAPMARALARDGHAVIVSERNAEVAADLVAAYPEIEVAANQDVVDAAEVVFLCLRPAVAPEVVPGLRFAAGQRIVSVMAGITMADLRGWCAPAEDLSMTIPLGFLEAGGCPLAVFPSVDPLDSLFGSQNPVIAVRSEEALNAHFATCALVPGILSLLEEGTDWLAAKTGDAAAAERYTSALMAGFLATMEAKPGHLAQERAALATQGTLSLMMVEGLATGGAREAVRANMEAIAKRLGVA